MAPRKKDTAIALCDKAVALGNTIAIRMLEYFSTGRHQVQGFRELANEFLDVGRILWSIETGLKSSAADSKQKLPADMLSELEKRFRQTHDDFVVLQEIVTRFLENDKKTGFAKFAKGFKMMFADSRVDKMRASLERSREALKMSALVFRWTYGEEELDQTIGIGYTGLSAVLDRLNGTQKPIKAGPTPVSREAPSSLPPTQQPQAQPPQAALPELPRQQGHFQEEGLGLPHPPVLPALSIHERSRSPQSFDFMGNRLTGTTHIEEMHDLQGLPERAPSTIRSARSSKGPNQSMIRELTASELSSPMSTGGRSTIHGDNASTHTAETDTMLEDLLSEVDMNDHRGDRVKSDMSAVPRWEPRFTSGAGNQQYKEALLQAIQRRAHSTAEQLLNHGVEPDTVSDFSLLREAIMNKDIESIRLLLLYKADPNHFDKHGCTPLYTATELGFIEAATLLVKYGADPNLSAGPNADTPLAMAVLENRLDHVRLFLKSGSDPNRIMANGNTVLVRAIDRKTHKAVIELLLNCGSGVDTKNGEGTSPMFQSISAQRLDIAHLLLDRGADPNLPGPKHLLWPSTYQPAFLRLLLARGADPRKAPGIMELATSVNSLESVRILLNSGVDPNAKKDGVYTPLCSAIRDNRADIVSLLLANGADPNVPASEYPCFKCVTHQRAHFLPQVIEAGGDPTEPRGIIEKAVLHNNQDALMILLDHGVNVNAKSAEGYTPLTTAIRENRTEMVDLLLARGADVAIRGQDWPINMAVKRPNILKKLLPAVSNPKMFKGVVEMAVCANQLESIKLLLSAGFSVEDKNGGVFSPLTSAIRERNKEIVHYLIDVAGADVNAPGEHLPIIKALRKQQGQDTEVLELLLERGANINLMYRGWNAVLQAVENGDAHVLRILVEKGNGVDLDQRDENDQTVMDIVNGHGWEEAVQILNNSGRRMSVFSSLSWGDILGEGGKEPMDTLDED
ncbi:hypothetical protein N0V82_000969 [Gnomoniopsis sp. IMI 355080]|nr:hypothetical protein N0V82_000969 [Gnomoniopsis sp. IMI 355080]